MDFKQLFNIKAGSVVPGRAFNPNAKALVDLDVRDKDGISINGSEVSAGDELTVLDISASRQLALVQYPIGGGRIKQGYVTNNVKYINFYNQYTFHNKSTSTEVINADGTHLGSLDSNETCTAIYTSDGLTEVVYDTNNGINTKSGFIRNSDNAMKGAFFQSMEYPQNGGGYKHTYGYSGKGRELNYYKLGSGSKALIYTCAVHGWEDNWAGDGIELVRIGNQLVDHFTKNGTGDFTLYIIPAVNPDGVAEGFTNDGQGRCTIKGAIDCNRDFPITYIPYGPARHWTNTHALSVSETNSLANLIQGTIKRNHSDCYLIDMHGWEQSAIGNADIAKHFISKFNLTPKLNRYGDNGYLIEWAHSMGIKSMLLELPNDTKSHSQVVSRNYAGKIIQGVSELINAVTTGWVNKDGKWYYFNSDGSMKKNEWFTQSNGQTFYFGADGIKYTGTHKEGSETWVFDGNGALERKWKLINGSWHVYNKDGAMHTGWLEEWSSWYYFNNDGGMRTNAWLKQLNGQTFYLGADGIKYIGKHTIGGVEYTFNSAGILQGNLTGWQTIDGKRYYFDAHGNKVTGWQTIENHVYKFGDDGKMITGWVHEWGVDYYFGADGAQYTGKRDIGGNTYFFNNQGIKQINTTIDGYTIGVDGIATKVTTILTGQSLVYDIINKLYNKAKDYFQNEGIYKWNYEVFNYIRRIKYNDPGSELLHPKIVANLEGVAWDLVIPVNTKFWYYVDQDSSLKKEAHKIMNNELFKLNNSIIGLPHLSATTLGYCNHGIIPQYWSGWGADLATAIGEVIYASKNYANDTQLLNKLYTYAYELIGRKIGSSSFGLDNFYEDIDSLYFSSNLSKLPLAELLKNYYDNLVYLRKDLITNSIKKDNLSLADSIYETFTGPDGLEKDARGISLLIYIFTKAKEELFISPIEKNSQFIIDIYRVCSNAFAARINSLKNGYLEN